MCSDDSSQALKRGMNTKSPLSPRANILQTCGDAETEEVSEFRVCQSVKPPHLEDSLLKSPLVLIAQMAFQRGSCSATAPRVAAAAPRVPWSYLSFSFPVSVAWEGQPPPQMSCETSTQNDLCDLSMKLKFVGVLCPGYTKLPRGSELCEPSRDCLPRRAGESSWDSCSAFSRF